MEENRLLAAEITIVGRPFRRGNENLGRDETRGRAGCGPEGSKKI